jgi:conjugative relaxase-like TrwC/TraI family protein
LLSLAKIGRGREEYYLRAVGALATEYYSERGEVAGRWLGGGAAALGLAGRVQDHHLMALLAGYAPDAQFGENGWTGQQLVAAPRAGRRMPGIDACFAAPKSVSLLWAFGDRLHVNGRRVDQVIEAAHDEAVQEALAYLEAAAARGRRGHDGLVQMATSGFAAGAFRQRTSRADDPHLHTHVLLTNVCEGTDGRWGALDARLIYAHTKATGYLYDAHLRDVLRRELGVLWAPVENGLADIAGVPEEMILHFSKRAQELRGSLEEITQRLNEERARLGMAPVEADSQDALNIAAQQTRAAKLYHVATDELRADWHGQTVAAGHDLSRLAAAVGHPTSPNADLAPNPDLYHRVAAQLTEEASTFGRRDAIQEMAAAAAQGAPVSTVLERVDEFLVSGAVVNVGSGAAPRAQDVIQRDDGAVAPVPTGENRWSTPELLAVERRLVETAMTRRHEGAVVLPEAALVDALGRAVQRIRLGADQVQMVVQLARDGAGVQCVEAGPGSGKTTALGVYIAASQLAGVRVIGCAPSARARDELRLGALLEPCYTVDRLLMELERDHLQRGSVVILDEASMAGTRKVARLFEHAVATGTKVVMVGDTKQLSSVDAGGAFRGLVKRLGALELTENRRQQAVWERSALRQLRDEKVRQALDQYAANGRLHLGDREELVPQLVDAWWTASQEGEAVMQAARWRDVIDLNRRARARLVAAGAVSPDGIEVRGMTIGVGDQVIVQRNDRTLGVINGTLGTVLAIDREGGDIVIQTDGPTPKNVRLPAGFLNARSRRPRLALSYCRTIHKSQAATYRGASFTLAGDESIYLEAVHVALSRATISNHLYYTGEQPPGEDHPLEAVEIAEPHHGRLVAATARSRAQVMALDILQQLDRPPGQRVVDDGSESAPMTEAQAAILARRGVVPDRDLTWVEASLLIDQATGKPRGKRATAWLLERGLSEEEAKRILERAEQTLAQPSDRPLSTAVDGRLEQLDKAARAGRRQSRGQRQEREGLKQWQTGAARSRRRQTRERWAAAQAPSPGAGLTPPQVGGDQRQARSQARQP